MGSRTFRKTVVSKHSSFVNACILFLFAFYELFQLFGNQGCKYKMAAVMSPFRCSEFALSHHNFGKWHFQVFHLLSLVWTHTQCWVKYTLCNLNVWVLARNAKGPVTTCCEWLPDLSGSWAAHLDKHALNFTKTGNLLGLFMRMVNSILSIFKRDSIDMVIIRTLLARQQSTICPNIWRVHNPKTAAMYEQWTMKFILFSNRQSCTTV